MIEPKIRPQTNGNSRAVHSAGLAPDQQADASCPALNITGLSAGYPGARTALHDVHFSVWPGERVAVIGPNGAGKSTLFKAIAGLIPHSAGQVSIHGQDCRTSHDMVGYVPQHNAIDWNFPVTVRDVVMMGRTREIGWLRWPRRQDWQTVDALLERVGMADFRRRQIGQLSGGQKQRVFIARALAQETDVLLLDEPFSGVDATAEAEVMDLLDQLHTERVTVLLATHDLNMAATRFDRLLLLKQTVIAYGEPGAVFQPAMLQQAYGGRLGIFEQDGQTIIFADEHGCG